MPTKKIIILIEDEPLWLKRLNKTITDALDVIVEPFASFKDAEDRILQLGREFDLLITDIYENDRSKETKGLTFAHFVKKFRKTPVIVITGEKSQVRPTQKNININDVFDKGTFDRIEFVEAIRLALGQDLDNENKSGTGTIF